MVNFGAFRRSSGIVAHQACVSRTVASSGRYLSPSGFRTFMTNRHHSVVVALEHRPGNRLFDLVLREESVVVNPGESDIGTVGRCVPPQGIQAS